MAQRKERVEKRWQFLEMMQALIDGGTTANDAAGTVADKHWRDIASPRASKGHYAATQWLKRNQRRFHADLKRRTLREQLDERNRQNPNWRPISEEEFTRRIDAAIERARLPYPLNEPPAEPQLPTKRRN
jgi:hypothetical protein